jgi:hypothetical protein
MKKGKAQMKIVPVKKIRTAAAMQIANRRRWQPCRKH